LITNTTSALRRRFCKATSHFDEILQNGFDGQDFLSGLNDHFRKLLVAKNPQTAELLQASPALRNRYRQQAARCSTGFLFKALDTCNQYDLNYKISNNKRLHVEIALTQLSTLSKGRPAANDAEQVTASTESKPVYQKPPVPAPKHTYQQPVKPEPQATVTPEKTATTTVSDKSKTEETAETPAVKNNPEVPEATAPAIMPAQQKTKIIPARPAPGKSNAIRNISIKNTLNALKAKNTNNQGEPEPVIANTFTRQQLEKAWNNFVKNYKAQSPSFVLTLAKGNPELRENFKIEYHVPNSIIKDDKLNVNILLDYLKRELNNNQITLEGIVDSHARQKEAYTDRERFDVLAKKNPKLNRLKDELDLELEF